MPQYLVSVWHDDTFEVDFRPLKRSSDRSGKRVQQ